LATSLPSKLQILKGSQLVIHYWPYKDEYLGYLLLKLIGIPGGGVTVRIQGQNSIRRENDPFYVIDGVPYTSQLLSRRVPLRRTLRDKIPLRAEAGVSLVDPGGIGKLAVRRHANVLGSFSF